MLDEIGVFTPEQARELWQDFQRRKQLEPHVQHNYPQHRQIDEVSPHRVFVSNTSGELIPQYACMKITGTVTVGGRTALTVDKPDSTEGEFVFNSQYAIAIGAVGWAYRYGIVVMLGNGTSPTAAGVEYSPVVSSWAITEGAGPFIVFGDHVDATDAVIGRFAGGGGALRIWFTIDSVECVSATELILTVTPTWFTGGCTATIPGEDSYGDVIVEDICGTLLYYTAEWLVGKTGSATYMYPRTGTCTAKWLVDSICGTPECS